MGDGAIPFAILGDVGIEEVEGDTAYLDLPHMAVDGVARVGYLEDEGRLPVLLEDLLEGELGEVLRLVAGLLLALGAQRLGEVAVAVEEAHGRHTDVAIAGLLEVVPSQDAETTRVDLEDIGQPVLHAEVGDAGALGVGGFVDIGLIIGIDSLELGHQCGIGGDALDILAGELAEQHDGIPLRGLPQLGGKGLVEAVGTWVPYPPEVVC